MTDSQHAPGQEEVPEEGRSSFDQVSRAAHSVVLDVGTVENARMLIEELEEHGIPTSAISLVGVETKDRHRPGRRVDIPEAGAFADVSKSTVVGGALGLAIGAVLGLLMGTIVVPDLGWIWGAVMGGIFGAAIGGAAGGMSVAKYSSPAWDETYQATESVDSPTAVAVSHADPEIVESAERVMRRHEESAQPTRLEGGSETPD